ncbi:MAG: hypothetical protein HY868_09995 [Chloroflexi bacterium]|nr:hypothetical protein [Chloroflexota bacterium]
MDDFLQENFQIATLVVIVIIVLVCMALGLIFVNPQVALNPFKPPLPTPTAIAALPPTWTPTPTNTPTGTRTPTATGTPTVTPTETPIPSATPILPTSTPTRRPTPRPTRPPAPTASPYIYTTFIIECKHAGGTYIEGYATNAQGEESGVRVRLGSTAGGDEIQTVTTGSNRSPGYYVFVLNDRGSRPGTYYVWVVDGNGRAISNPSVGRVTTNDIRNSDDPSACWRAVVSFGRR